LEKRWGEIKNCAWGFEITSFNKWFLVLIYLFFKCKKPITKFHVFLCKAPNKIGRLWNTRIKSHIYVNATKSLVYIEFFASSHNTYYYTRIHVLCLFGHSQGACVLKCCHNLHQCIEVLYKWSKPLSIY
jgi:hypothetical protein